MAIGLNRSAGCHGNEEGETHFHIWIVTKVCAMYMLPWRRPRLLVEGLLA